MKKIFRIYYSDGNERLVEAINMLILLEYLQCCKEVNNIIKIEEVC